MNTRRIILILGILDFTKGISEPYGYLKDFQGTGASGWTFNWYPQCKATACPGPAVHLNFPTM
ncbi:MAG TPA: hypothetical protein VFC02_13875, partial [Anaerolineales bacterium]|nr:hypothetical protein [Anaerolineales bacterium]